MPPRKDKKAVPASPKTDKPLRKLSALSLGSFSASGSAASSNKPKPAASSSRTKGKRKVEVIELDSDVEEIRDSSDDDRPKPSASVGSRVKDKGKGKAAAVPAARRKKEPATPAGHVGDQQAHLWTDVYAPTKMDELAPNKKKVGEVRDWLSEALPPLLAGSSTSQAAKISRYRRVIVLTGPAGVGKTACIKAVADEMDCELVEWAEGFEEWGMSGGDSERESVIGRLETFMLRSSFPSLNVPSPAASTSTAGAAASAQNSKRKILLLDALPNLAHQETRAAFQALLRQFAQTDGGAPLVLIVSDSGETGRAGEGWGERGRDGGWGWRDILGKEVMALAGVRVVSFNPVPPTALAKALNRILPLAVPLAARRPPKDAVQLIVHSAQGDVRSAVNALQFLCRAQVPQAKTAAPAKKATGKGSRGGKPPRGTDKALKSLLDAVTRREQSLALFHALGKVLWNKRLGDPTQEAGEEEDYPPLPPVQIPLPAHLAASKRRQSKVDVEVLFKEAPVDTGLFNLYLHQNYPVFCSDVDECAASIETLSRSDALRTDDDLWQSSPIAIAYAFNTTVRGLLASLPTPMPHRGQKVYKPDWFAAFREQRTNEEAVDDVGRWAAKEGLGLGQTSRKVLTTELIPALRHLNIPPTYPASLPDLAILDSSAAALSRSAANLQAIVLGTDDAALDPDDDEGAGDEAAAAAALVGGSVELLEGSVERQTPAGAGLDRSALMFTARDVEGNGDDLGGEGEDDDGGSAAGEVEGDEIADFSA